MSIVFIRIFCAAAITASVLQAYDSSALRKSVDLAKSGRVEAAESVLEQKTFHPSGTYSWHFEVAGRLLQAAFLARESADLATSQNLANRALAHLDKIDQGLPTDSALAIRALEMRADIVERLTGTSTEAEALRAEARRRDGREDAARDAAAPTAAKVQSAEEVRP